MIYELLCGERAIDATEPVHIMKAHVDDTPIVLPDGLDLPSGLRRVVNKMLRKDAAHRYASATEVLQDLTRLKPVGTRSDTLETDEDELEAQGGPPTAEVVERAASTQIDTGPGFNEGHAEPSAPKKRADRLSACSIAADSAQVRQCCVEELGGQDAFVELLDRPDTVPLREALEDFTALVGASFPSVPVASAAADGGNDEDGDEERFGEHQAAVQDWVVDVGCRLKFSDPSSQKTAEAFVPLIESDGCAPTDPPWQGYYSDHSWAAMCTGMYEYRREQLDMKPREAMCDSLGRASLARATTATQLSVAAAIGVAQQVNGVHKNAITWSRLSEAAAGEAFPESVGPPTSSVRRAAIRLFRRE